MDATTAGAILNAVIINTTTASTNSTTDVNAAIALNTTSTAIENSTATGWTTGLETDPEADYGVPLGEVFAALDLTFVPFILVGNCLVLSAVLIFRRLQTVANRFLASLAAADLLVGLVTIPLYTPFYLGLGGLDHIKLACLLRFAAIIFSCGCSLLNLALVAVDRYVAIVFPLRYKALLSWHRGRRLVAASWLLMLILSLLPMLGWNHWDRVLTCDFYAVMPMPYVVLAVFSVVFLSVTVTSVLYVLVMVEAWRQQRRVRTMSWQQPGSTRHQLEKDLRAAKVTMLVSVLFVVFWLPYMVAGPLKYLPLSLRSLEIIKNFTLCLAISNSLINPFIYGWLKRDFRSAYRLLLQTRVTRWSQLQSASLSLGESSFMELSSESGPSRTSVTCMSSVGLPPETEAV